MTPLFGILGLSPMEVLIIAGLGVLLFGRKLPEVGRYLGKGIIEFKKGMKGLEDDADGGYTGAAPPPPPQHQEVPRPPQRITSSAPRFDDPANPGTAPRI